MPQRRPRSRVTRPLWSVRVLGQRREMPYSRRNLEKQVLSTQISRQMAQGTVALLDTLSFVATCV